MGQHATKMSAVVPGNATIDVFLGMSKQEKMSVQADPESLWVVFIPGTEPSFFSIGEREDVNKFRSATFSTNIGCFFFENTKTVATACGGAFAGRSHKVVGARLTNRHASGALKSFVSWKVATLAKSRGQKTVKR